ncbi:MAG TPA: cytochrome C, partial [Hyphomicrobium sp.]|nr:cytochrome C [Hyphomicrobium sp.]
VYSPHPGAPSFTSVAKTSGMTGRALAVWLDTSHPTMPNFVLRTEDRDNVVAYIMSLKDVRPSK